MITPCTYICVDFIVIFSHSFLRYRFSSKTIRTYCINVILLSNVHKIKELHCILRISWDAVILLLESR